MLGRVAFLCTLASANARRVHWYLNGGALDANAAFVTEHADALTGVFLCCGAVAVSATGEVSGNATEIAAQVQAVKSAYAASSRRAASDLDVWAMFGIAEASVLNGTWQAAGAPAAIANILSGTGVTGAVCDYEPTNDYTQQHALLYTAFLNATAEALSGLTPPLLTGADVADWSILDFWSVYAPSRLALLTSMTPTYTGLNLTRNEDFALGMLAAGIAPERIGLGLGTQIAPPGVPEWQYNWTEPKLRCWLSFCAVTGLPQIDVWRADIDHYNVTEPYYFSALSEFLAGNDTGCA